MIRLEGIDILLTYQCTSRCNHCCYRASPNCRQTMTLAEVGDYLEQVADHQLKNVLLFGGEPFCCFVLLRDSVRLAHQVAPVLVFTNGSWATSRSTAEQLLSQLKAVGLDYLLFSVDAFHQAHVPVERIAVGIQAAQALQFGSVAIDNRCVGNPTDNNPFNQGTKELMVWLGEQCDLGNVTISAGPTRMVGRAAETLTSVHCDGGSSGPTCAFPSSLGKLLLSPTGVEIHPGGRVNLCAGLATRERLS